MSAHIKKCDYHADRHTARRYMNEIDIYPSYRKK